MQEKHVSRKKHKTGFILVFIFPILVLVSNAIKSGLLLLFSLLILLIAGILMFRTNRCPYCGEFFRGCYWEKANAGFCRRCGKLIEFDDFADPNP